MDDPRTRMNQALAGLKACGDMMQALAVTAREAAEAFLALHETLLAEHEEEYPSEDDDEYDAWPDEDYDEDAVPFWADKD